MSKNDPNKIRTANDADRYLTGAGCEVARQSGSHRIYKHPNISKDNKYPFFTVPQHNGDMNPNIRRALIRAILAAGLVLALVAALMGA